MVINGFYLGGRVWCDCVNLKTQREYRAGNLTGQENREGDQAA
ncbi:hypothetical protein RchiOBHm_Chr7g0185421 [Rosa chinensis]|uniref:Uncharacterized protein n=1 Tax=Rosa chinensis TaxID=74649 RepID=A0A2P6P3N8_ROSCH|nr:hypothetical protein RchiOBHm_Chr7g0185421 [Rosa chinensis]